MISEAIKYCKLLAVQSHSMSSNHIPYTQVSIKERSRLSSKSWSPWFKNSLMKILALYLTSILQYSPKYVRNIRLAHKFLYFTILNFNFAGLIDRIEGRLIFHPPPSKLVLLRPWKLLHKSTKKMFCSAFQFECLSSDSRHQNILIFCWMWGGEGWRGQQIKFFEDNKHRF